MEEQEETSNVDEDDAISPMTELPDEILLMILSLLDTEDLYFGGAVRSVCRRWRDLSKDPSVWRHRHAECGIFKNGFGEMVWVNTTVLRTVKVAPELDKLTLVFTNNDVLIKNARTLIEGCSRVRHLKVDHFLEGSSQPLMPAGFNKILQDVLNHYSAFAEILDLSLSTDVSGSDILHALASASLRTLRLATNADCTRPDGEGIKRFAERCPGLRDLDLEHFDVQWANKLLVEVASVAQLSRIVMPGRDIGMVMAKDDLEQLGSSCKALSFLGADYYHGGILLRHLPALRSLRLWYSVPGLISQMETPMTGTMSSSALLRGVTCLERLQHLELEMDKDLRFPSAILGACQQLQSLHLSGEGLDKQLLHLLPVAPDSILDLYLCSRSLMPGSDFMMKITPLPAVNKLVRSKPNLVSVRWREGAGRPWKPL